MLGGWNCKERCKCGMKKISEVAKKLPLSGAPAGKPLKVASVGGDRKLCSRMASMGIYPGAEMELICAGCGSCNCVVRVRGGTLSLGEGVSENIMVTPAV